MMEDLHEIWFVVGLEKVVSVSAYMHVHPDVCHH